LDRKGRKSELSLRNRRPDYRSKLRFELFVVAGFSGFELSAITHTLSVANAILDEERFTWRFVSSTPGIVSGTEGIMVRAEPAIDNYGFSDLMIVVGGRRLATAAWMKRARAMQRLARPVVLLSDAATTFITSTKAPKGQVTTHWRDAGLVNEARFHPELTSRMAENSDGIITCAGEGGTAEIVIGLISEQLDTPVIVELANRLLLPQVRKSDAEQPKDISGNEALFGAKVMDVIKLMEGALADPLPIPALAKMVGISPRQTERLFRAAFDETPARFYKRLRAKQARAMIEETLIPIIDVAVATGFGSVDTLAKAIKEEYGVTPSKMRARQKVELLKFRSR
jgi:transcriptional regulator GlxA family with amidase domain